MPNYILWCKRRLIYSVYLYGSLCISIYVICESFSHHFKFFLESLMISVTLLTWTLIKWNWKLKKKWLRTAQQIKMWSWLMIIRSLLATHFKRENDGTNDSTLKMTFLCCKFAQNSLYFTCFRLVCLLTRKEISCAKYHFVRTSISLIA